MREGGCQGRGEGERWERRKAVPIPWLRAALSHRFCLAGEMGG